MNRFRGVMSTVLFGMSIVLGSPAFAQRTNTTVVKPEPVGANTSTPLLVTGKPLTPVPAIVSPTSPKPSSTPPPSPPPPPKPPLPPALRETPNNPLAAPQNIDDLLRLRMTEDLWVAMYSPLSCLDVTPDCIARLQQEAVQNSPVIKQLEAKIATVNQKIEEAKTNNKKSIELSIFEPALQVFLKQETVVENGQTVRSLILEKEKELSLTGLEM